jgi:hypothetical protein
MPLIISCNSLPNCVVGVPFSHFFSSNTPGTFWSIYNAFFYTNQPSGTSFNNATGEIAGIPDIVGWTPAQVGAHVAFYSMIIRGSVGGDTDQIVCSMGSYQNCLPLFGTFLGPSSGSTGVAYTGALSATDGIAPYSFVVTGGALPDGLTMDLAGNITGTPTLNGVFTAFVTITGTGSAINNVATVNVTITIGGAPSVTASQLYFMAFGLTPPLGIVCGDPADGVVNVGYAHLMPILGGAGPFVFEITFGALPDGLTIDAATGLISGTPTVVNTFNFTVRVTDSALTQDSVECSITILDTLAIDCDNPPDGASGVPYSHFILASGGVPPYTFSIVAGALPDGLAIVGASGEIAGTPTAAGTFTFTVRVTDSYAGGPDPNTADIQCSITITGIIVSCNNPPAGKIGIDYHHTFTAVDGTPPLIFSILIGALPPGLALNANTGEVTGKPTLSGFYEFTVLVVDADEAQGQVNCSITIKRCLLVDLTT